jgi:hypothetical protein
MSNEQQSKPSILETALKVFSQEEIQNMPTPSLKTLGVLIGRRLSQAGPPPTHAELVGIRDLFENYLTLPGLGWKDKVDQLH